MSTATDFVAEAGLEVSGIMKSTEGYIRRRVQEKLQQARQTDTQGWDSFAIVVESSRPLAEVQRNEH